MNILQPGARTSNSVNVSTTSNVDLQFAINHSSTANGHVSYKMSDLRYEYQKLLNDPSSVSEVPLIGESSVARLAWEFGNEYVRNPTQHNRNRLDFALGLTYGDKTSEGLKYLLSNPDVLAAAHQFLAHKGATVVHYVDFAIDHFWQFGKHENRAASGFNPTEYGKLNPDVAAAYPDDVGKAWHYITRGKAEGRQTG